MVLVLSEINCTSLKERLNSGQNCTENKPLRTPEGLISSTRLKQTRWTWNFGILHKSTWRLCVPFLSEIDWPSCQSLSRSLRQQLFRNYERFSKRKHHNIGRTQRQSIRTLFFTLSIKKSTAPSLLDGSVGRTCSGITEVTGLSPV